MTGNDDGVPEAVSPAPVSLPSQLAALGIRPRKSLGQHFLVDPVHLERIVAAADLHRSDTVLEVGPGPGVLTGLIAARAGRVVAIELDERLVSLLSARFAGGQNVLIVHADILKVDVGRVVLEGDGREVDGGGEEQAPRSYKVIANLPYYITAAVVRRLLESEPPPELLVLTVQREVAERMVAGPPRMSLLALGVQYYCTARIVGRIPSGAFWPAPQVESAVVRLDRRPRPAVAGVTAEAFFRAARAGFSRPRKQLRHALAGGLAISPAAAAELLTAVGVDPARRAETLALEEWGRVAAAVR